MELLLSLVSVIVISLISVVVVIPLLLKKKITVNTKLFLLGISVGVLLSTVFFDFLPETLFQNYSLDLSLYILLGFIIMFALEKIVHYQHNTTCEKKHIGHAHAYNVAPINLIGDGIHNFIDGLIIVSAYTVNISLGIAATIAVIFHEIPQEIADFGVLLYSGFSKKKALLFNIISATTSIFGVLLGYLFIEKISGFTNFIIPFAAGNFIYIAASNLVPQLHMHCTIKDALLHILAILLGVGIILFVTLFGPIHI